MKYKTPLLLFIDHKLLYLYHLLNVSLTRFPAEIIDFSCVCVS
jgi:hypothetical protein